MMYMFTQQTVVCFDQNSLCRQLLPTCSCPKISLLVSFHCFVFLMGFIENILILRLYLCTFGKDDLTFTACFNGP